MKNTFSASLLLLVGGLCAASSAHAERADRDQPVNLEAARVTVDDIKRTHVFEGNVVLTQGSLVIRAAKLVVTQNADGFQKGVATGGENGLARFRQKREGLNEYIEGEGERVEYDSRAEKAEFFNRAYVKSGMDEVRGHYISYDGRTEQYFVTAPPGSSPNSKEGRVTAVIQPKNKAQPAAAGATTTPAAPAAPAPAPAR